jgi:hypothetical protein
MALNVKMPAPIKVKDEELRQTNKFTYLGSIITSEGAQRRTSTADWARPEEYLER